MVSGFDNRLARLDHGRAFGRVRREPAAGRQCVVKTIDTVAYRDVLQLKDRLQTNGSLQVRAEVAQPVSHQTAAVSPGVNQVVGPHIPSLLGEPERVSSQIDKRFAILA